MSYTPTPGQRAAIEARGQNILVNAGAGAGKTATLIERVYRLITAEQSPVSLENMLIVTFTRAAATEMKERLAERLLRELAAARESAPHSEHTRRLHSQLTILPRAPISTLHSFCLRLLRENSEAVNLPPDFDLISEEEALLIHREHIEAALEETLKDERWKPVLFEILEQLTPDPQLKQVAGLVRRIHSFLEASADPEGFVATVLREYEEAANPAIPFNEKALGRRVRETVMAPLLRARDALDNFLSVCPMNGLVAKGPRAYREAAVELREAINIVLTMDPGEGLPDFNEMLRLPRRSSVTKNSTPQECDLNRESGLLKDRLDAAREELAQLDAGLSLDELLAQVVSTKPYVELLLDHLGLKLIDKLLEYHMGLRRLTYAHLERLALRVLIDGDSTTPAARRLREEFDYVLVDEFQDVNELQARLLAAVSREGNEGNQFVVGDVKQSIYGFRQADPRQFLALFNQYREYNQNNPAVPGARINLPENFRSQPALLNALNGFFEILFCERIGQVAYDKNHAFVPGRPDNAQGTCFEVHLLEQEPGAIPDDPEAPGDDPWMESDEAEARYVAKLIRECNHPLRDIAVLLRSASGTATKLVEAFQAAGIPYFTQESIGFLNQQEVMDVLSILRVVDNPYNEVCLVGALRGPAAEWNEDDLVRLRLVKRHGRLFDNLKLIVEDFAHPLNEKAAAFLSQLRAWQQAARSEGMADFFGRLYTDLALRERVAALPNGDQRLNNLQFLQDRGVQFDSFRRKGLAQFLEFLDDLMERNEDLGQPALVSPGADVVRIMTIHKSKGLEFPVVILPSLGKRFNRTDLNENAVWDRDGGFFTRFLPGRRYGEDRTSIARQLILPKLQDRLRSEELRLLYVAMTRARKALHDSLRAKHDLENRRIPGTDQPVARGMRSPHGGGELLPRLDAARHFKAPGIKPTLRQPPARRFRRFAGRY